MISSVSLTGRGTLARFILLAGAFWLLAGPTTAAAFEITRAEWDAAKTNLKANVDGVAGADVTLRNAYDLAQVLGTGTIKENGEWKIRTKIHPAENVPCRVRADYSEPQPGEPQLAERDVVDPVLQDVPADCAPTGDGGPGNQPPVANANGPYNGTVGLPMPFSSGGSSDPDGSIVSYEWDFGDGDSSTEANPTHNYDTAGNYSVTLTVTDDEGDSDSDATTATITVDNAACPDFDPSAVPAASINSASQASECQNTTVVAEQEQVANTSYSVVAINDLGMHCGDYDTRIASILPPFQVLLAQVIQKGSTPTLNPAGVDLYYSAVSNPDDPIVDTPLLAGVMADGSTYKTNFWDTVAMGAYNPFYPFDVDGMVPADLGLPVPNVEELYIGGDGQVNSGDESLTAVQHAMPSMTNPMANPYVANVPQLVQEHYAHKPFFVDFPFGYVANDVNWNEGAGIPFAAFDDVGSENAYPLVRVEARSGNTTLSTVDTVLPISGEASCANCHTTLDDYVSVHGNGTDHRSNGPTDALSTVGLPVATTLDDPDDNLPPKVSLEYAADINILRLHDLKHGADYVSPTGDGVASEAACDIQANDGNGDSNCLTNKSLVQEQPVVCQVCHYTPALDLAHVGPKTGPAGSEANGRNQLAHQSNSRVMHNHHGQFDELFTPIPAPTQDPVTGAITNQAERLAALEESCYQCHPGKNIQCLRGAMFNADILCSDCHGSMEQVGADFSTGVSPSNPGDFKLAGLGNFYEPGSLQPRVPWANEPGCGSCHTGDANNNLANLAGAMPNSVDTDGNTDGIRLRQAYRTGDPKATPIVPVNTRFAENPIPASFNGFANPGAGAVGNTGAQNPKLYRVSTGHGGVFCEGCHGATHAEWPNANPFANDNVTANQLQGHVGTLSECSTCHDQTSLDSLIENGQALEGPHGMHPVNAPKWIKGGGIWHGKVAKIENGNPNGGACAACHGPDHKGTVLSRTPVDRNLIDEDGKTRATVATDDVIGCDLCHSLEKSFSQ
jgi:hypothetical protein